MRAATVVLLLAACGSDARVEPDGGTATDGGRHDAGSAADAGGLPPPPERAAALCAALDEYLAGTNTPGAVLATRFPDGSTHACAGGVASIADATPMRTGDRFRIGSVSKTFVAATVLLLAEDGLLSLEDPLSRWVAGFEESDPTLAQMLNHTSGLGEYLFDDGLQATRDQPHDAAELVDLARSKPIARPPGGRFEYANTNYLLMSTVIEAATRTPWQQIVRERVLDPLALEDTFVYGFEETPPFVTGYEWDRSTNVDVTVAVHPTVASAAGCFVSSAADLLRWAEALYGGSVLSPASLEAMNELYRVPHAHDGGVYEGAFVGLANFIETDETFGEVYGHSGGLPGFGTNMRYMEREGRVLVVLVNGTDPTADPNPIDALTNAGWIALLL